ncbi:hypothetical protein MLD38_013130 [Melastoma candidum]|uniref:Uncharacterized protein n=1 Tax=Melastoma candidum TaxID=119954 RepID=A0ACB9R8K4_9MYRT|nr:hypothetical protein MLD38_013130 [Melastoma candidum]
MTAASIYRSDLKKKGTPTPDPEDDNNSKPPGDASSGSTRGMVINEPAPIITKDAARHVKPLQMPNLTSLLAMQGHILQPPCRDVYTQPNFPGGESSNMAMQWNSFFAQLSTRFTDEFSTSRNLSSSQLIMNRGFGVLNQLQGNRLPLPPAPSYEDSPPRHNLSPVDYQPGELDWLLMDLGVPTVGAIPPQVTREPSPNQIAPDNTMVDPVANVTLYVPGSFSAGRTSNPESSDPYYCTSHDTATSGWTGESFDPLCVAVIRTTKGASPLLNAAASSLGRDSF